MERAYVAFTSGVDRDHAAREAIEWALGRRSRQHPEVVLWLPHRDNLRELPSTRRLVKKELTVCSDRPGRSRPLPDTGPVVAFCQPVERLVELEPAAHPVVLVGALSEDLVDSVGAGGFSFHQPWVDAFDPCPLGGGPVIRRRPPLGEDPVVAAAMEDFTAATFGGVTMYRPDDGGRVAHGLLLLRTAGHQVDADGLCAAALQQGWRGREALRLRDVAREVAAGRNKRPGARFDASALSRWQAAGNARRSAS